MRKYLERIMNEAELVYFDLWAHDSGSKECLRLCTEIVHQPRFENVHLTVFAIACILSRSLSFCSAV